MRCPYCGSTENRVVDSRSHDEDRAIRRRRECLGCEQRFTTSERIDHAVLMVRKRNGSTQPFEPSQIQSGIAKACTDLDLSEETLRMVTGKVVAAVRASHRQVVTSEEIGTHVLTILKEINPVAWFRFASVYRKFTSADDIQAAMLELNREPSSPDQADHAS